MAHSSHCLCLSIPSALAPPWMRYTFRLVFQAVTCWMAGLREQRTALAPTRSLGDLQGLQAQDCPLPWWYLRTPFPHLVPVLVQMRMADFRQPNRSRRLPCRIVNCQLINRCPAQQCTVGRRFDLCEARRCRRCALWVQEDIGYDNTSSYQCCD